MESPLQYDKKKFINSIDDDTPQSSKARSQAVTFTLNQQDIELLEKQVDRSIHFGKRNKSKSAVIRMALKSLDNSSDEKYLELYSKY